MPSSATWETAAHSDECASEPLPRSGGGGAVSGTAVGGAEVDMRARGGRRGIRSNPRPRPRVAAACVGAATRRPPPPPGILRAMPIYEYRCRSCEERFEEL